MRGGKRDGAGRRKGSRAKKTVELLEAVQATGVTPLEFMLSKMRDPNESSEVRNDMAKAAAPYCHSKLASVEHSGNADKPIQHHMSVEFVGQ